MPKNFQQRTTGFSCSINNSTKHGRESKICRAANSLISQEVSFLHEMFIYLRKTDRSCHFVASVKGDQCVKTPISSHFPHAQGKSNPAGSRQVAAWESVGACTKEAWSLCL